MVNIHLFLYLAAVVLFILAALPTGWRIGCQWLAFAALTLTLIV